MEKWIIILVSGKLYIIDFLLWIRYGEKMSKFFFKIGIYFLILVLCIEIIVFVFFYKSFLKMCIVEEIDVFLEKGNCYSKKIKSCERWDEYYKEMKYVEYNKNFKCFVYFEFDIMNEVVYLVELELIFNFDIVIIIIDYNGKIILILEFVIKDM